MSWRDNLREASFRGVAFFYDDTDADIGRRNQRHEYPGQDGVYHEDLGRKVRVHTLNAYVWGDDADVQAVNLESAIETPGAGTLVHPTKGEMLVSVASARVRTKTKEGGYVTFALTFEETGAARRPQLAPATPARVDTASNTALEDIQKGFQEAFNVDGLPQFIADDAADQLSGSMDTIQGAFGDLRQDEQSLAGWVNKAGDVKARAAAIVRDPSLLVFEVANMIGVSLTLPGAQLSRSLSRLFDYGQAIAPIATLTATRTAQQTNTDAFTALVRQTAVIRAAQASVREPFANRTEALARRDQIADAIESETFTAPDTSYHSLVALRAEVVKGIDVQAARLPRLATVTPAITRPALALAHDLYGDDPALALALSDDLVVRNKLRHPGFVPGGDVLEVTVNG